MKSTSVSFLTFPTRSSSAELYPSSQACAQRSHDNVFDLSVRQRRARLAFDPYRMRVEFAEIWADYLRKHYGRAETVAYMFGVTFQTACNWLSGVSRPTGDKVMLEFASHPDRLLEHALKHMDRAA